MFTFRSASEADTEQLAKRLANWIEPGAVIALDGDLGAGKTRFSQALARAIGVKDVVNSPTFTIIKEYEGAQLPFYHMDVYRISMEEADELGLDEYFYGEGLTVVEWSSLITELLPPAHLHIYIEYAGETERLFHCKAQGMPYASWCEKLNENGV
jgi:tRNA threonylcarbamoyladenosine biosynthesis protein TsaE